MLPYLVPIITGSPSAPRRENPGAEPEPLPVAPLRENQGLETDRLRRRLSPGIEAVEKVILCYIDAIETH